MFDVCKSPILCTFDRQPIGTASKKQVHAASRAPNLVLLIDVACWPHNSTLCSVFLLVLFIVSVNPATTEQRELCSTKTNYILIGHLETGETTQ
jgi:hypothetical protein